ncbi:LTA synthase family protein [Floccifex sp.]|uniref:LTA synthase family protein n=1 Tax=Floccifex sp. TaxID=2815810 RepID=UPI003F0BB0F9
MLWIFIGLICVFSSKWAFSYFGCSCFEQIVYHIKVPLEGTNTQFIKDWIQKCGLPALFLSILLLWFPYPKIFFLICLLYAAFKIELILYIFHQFQVSDFFDRHYQEVKVTPPEKKMNLIHIYLESMESTYALKKEGGDSNQELLPFLTKLTKNNLSFSQNEKIGGGKVLKGTGWTTGGLVGSECGIPLLFPLNHPFCKEKIPFLKNVTSLGDILEKEGYHQVFMIGSNASFGGRRSFYQQHGYFEIKDILALKKEKKLDKNYHEFWGFEDDKLFGFAKEEVLKLSKENHPFHFSMLTVDTHHPYGYQGKTCEQKFKESVSNSIYHTDCLLKEFMDWCSKQDFYENTVFVIQGDHTSMAAEYISHTYDSSFDRRIWNVFIHSQKETENRERNFSTFDLFPTILSAMGFDVFNHRAGLGVDLFSNEKTLIEQVDSKKINSELSKRSKKYKELL